MSRSRWLTVMVAAGVLIFALSFIDAWVIHDREVRGEGYRFVQIVLSAWRSVAVPVLSLGVLAALGTAIAAVAAIQRPHRLTGIVLLCGSVLALALITSSIVPIAQDGHASSVDLSPGWLSAVGIGLGILMVGGAVVVARPTPAVALTLGLVGAVAFAGGAGGRWLALQRSEGNPEHWSDGSYSRADGSHVLTIEDGRYELAGRWSGAWEGSGLTIVLADDPACPGARGAYHAHDEGDDNVDLRFVKVVDTCGDGARAADLEGGIWLRRP